MKNNTFPRREIPVRNRHDKIDKIDKLIPLHPQYNEYNPINLPCNTPATNKRLGTSSNALREALLSPFGSDLVVST